MSTVSKQRKSVKPASGSCHWAVQPTDTHPGCLVINGTAYQVAAIRDGDAVTGYRLTKRDGTAYDLPADLSACDCPDATYRDRQCKHVKALRAALAALGQ